MNPPSDSGASGDGSDAESSSVVSPAAVWRHEMTHSERQILAALVSRMDAFQGKRVTKITALEMGGVEARLYLYFQFISMAINYHVKYQARDTSDSGV